MCYMGKLAKLLLGLQILSSIEDLIPGSHGDRPYRETRVRRHEEFVR